MDKHQDPEGTTQSGKDNLKDAAGDLKEAAKAKVEDFRQAAGQKADELREAAQARLKSSETLRRVPGRMRVLRRRVGKLKARLSFATIPVRLF